MLGSLKNPIYVKIPNYRCIGMSKTKNAWIQILLRQKDVPFNGELSQPPFADDLWRETQKVRSPSFYSYIISSSQVISDTMLYFYHLGNMILGSYLRE